MITMRTAIIIAQWFESSMEILQTYEIKTPKKKHVFNKKHMLLIVETELSVEINAGHQHQLQVEVHLNHAHNGTRSGNSYRPVVRCFPCRSEDQSHNPSGCRHT